VGIGFLEVQMRRNGAVPQRERDFNETHDTRRRFQVSDVRFGRSDEARIVSVPLRGERGA
jgi:hypothetical protein